MGFGYAEAGLAQALEERGRLQQMAHLVDHVRGRVRFHRRPGLHEPSGDRTRFWIEMVCQTGYD